MKIRTDFVTNSSSSSYVVAFKESPQIDKETLERYPFIAVYQKIADNMIFSGGEEDNETNDGNIVSTIKELDEYFVEEYGWGNCNTIEKILDDEQYLGKYKTCADYINKGYKILLKYIDYDDSRNELFESLISDNFVIISCF